MTNPRSILIVEDDRGVRESLAAVLEHEGHHVIQAETGDDGLARAAESPDLIILDINLPGIDGLEVCRRIRARRIETPVLMLTARHEVGDRVDGLDAGANDYLVKPFALAELQARVRALLRHVVVAHHTAPGIADLVVDPSTRQAYRGDRAIELTKIEFDLLELLVANCEVVLTREILHERVWGYAADLASNTLEVFIHSLRQKTEAEGEPRILHTVRGVGYVARLP